MKPYPYLRLLFLLSALHFSSKCVAQNCVGINLQDTLRLCNSTSVVLPATLTGTAANQPLDTQWTPATGLSNAQILNPTATVGSSPMMYVLTVMALSGQNLVANGDFSSGPTGFTSSYTNVQNPSYVLNEAEYAVVTDPFSVHIDFASFGDHTTGTGNMLVMNGSLNPNVSIWCQTINVQPNTTYDFSTWGATCVAVSPAILQFSINGVLLGNPFVLPATTATWQQFHATWFSGISTTATICIVNQNTAFAGNDFALDDISFRTICEAKDSVYVIPGGTSINADFSFTITDSCVNRTATFANTSIYAGSTAQFHWDFGDNTSYNGAAPPPHQFPSTGPYTVRLILTDPTACTPADTMTRVITFGGGHVTAAGNIPQVPCGVSDLSVASSSVNATSVRWFFGDGQSSTQATTTHHYAAAGTYEVMLVAFNGAACNKTDTLRKTVQVGGLPVASFSNLPFERNEPIQFLNGSSNATTYSWQFGDGTAASSAENPSHLFPQTGGYTVCLIASNGDCADTVCHPVFSDVNPIADVPKAFTPNGDGHNDVLYVRGVGVASLDFKVYDRWGRQVFRTSDMAVGWDGTVAGVRQEMEAYAYTLQATLINGTQLSKKGNVTLIR